MKKLHTKQGIASFYLVAMATLLLGVLTVGFSSYVVNEINRTTNFDLSKSAYDSALAGIQDAKLAIMNYNSCIKQGYVTASEPDSDSTVTCSEMLHYMQYPDCYMVGKMLGRITSDGEVLIKETETRGNTMQQAYTCVKITNPKDYRTSLNSSNSSRTIPLKVKNGNINDARTIKISWADNSGTNYNNTLSNGANLTFPSLASTAPSNPPMIALQLIQTANEFNLSDFDYSHGQQTNRGLIYLAPSDGKTGNSNGTITNLYVDVTAENKIGSTTSGFNGFVKSNDKTSQNLPYLVDCASNSDSSFLCSVDIELPEPVGGLRNEDTFILTVSLPYGGPDTDIAVTVCTTSGSCEATSSDDNITTGDQGASTALTIANQVRIDSTGRANNLYRRIESRVETNTNPTPNSTPPAMSALGSKNDTTIKKDVITSQEHYLTDVPAVNPNLTLYTLQYTSDSSLCSSPSGIPGSQIFYGKSYGKFTIPATPPTCGNNVTFGGWTTDNATQTPRYNEGSIVQTVQTTTTLYAVWKPKTYTIKYHNYQIGNRVVYHMDEVTYRHETTVKGRTGLQLSNSILPPKTNSDYEILGWAETQGSTTIKWTVGQTISPTSDMHLYAVWGKKVTYNFFQINNANESREATFYNDQYTATISIPAIKTDVQFNANGANIQSGNLIVKGWSTSAAEYKAASFNPDQQATVTDSTPRNNYATAFYTVTATYHINNRTYEPTNRNEKIADVNIISKGASGGVKADIGKITMPNPGKDVIGSQYARGMDLDYWTIGQGGTSIRPGVAWGQSVSFDVYAVLKYATYTVKFYSYDGATYYGAQEFTYNTSKAILIPSNDGWERRPTDYRPDNTKDFYGWSMDQSNVEGSVATYGYCVPGTSRPCSFKTEIYNDNHNMYAVWKKTITVNFYSGKSTPDKESKDLYNATMQATITSKAIPADSDSTLRAYTWSNSDNSISDNWDQNTSKTIGQSENRYAAYAKDVKVSYDKNSATASGTMEDTHGDAHFVYNASRSKTPINVQIKLSQNGFTNAGYNFGSWSFTDENGNTSAKNPQENIPIHQDTTVKANWGANMYTITLDKKGGSGGTDTIYEKYNVGYYSDANGNSAISSSNPVALPTKKYTVTLDYVYKSDETNDVYAVFDSYQYGNAKIVNNSGTINSNINASVSNNFTINAQWNAGKYTIPANETKTDYNCQWRNGDASGSTVYPGRELNVSSDITLTSVCTLALNTVTLKVDASKAYITSNASGQNIKVSDSNGTVKVQVKAGGTTHAITSGNSIKFTDNNGVYYYIVVNDTTNYEHNGWSVDNDYAITGDITINGNVKLVPWTCKETNGEVKVYDATYGADSGGYICVNGETGKRVKDHSTYTAKCHYDDYYLYKSNFGGLMHVDAADNVEATHEFTEWNSPYESCSTTWIKEYNQGEYLNSDSCFETDEVYNRKKTRSKNINSSNGISHNNSAEYYFPQRLNFNYGTIVTGPGEYWYSETLYSCRIQVFDDYGPQIIEGRFMDEYLVPTCASEYTYYPSSTSNSNKCYRAADSR